MKSEQNWDIRREGGKDSKETIIGRDIWKGAKRSTETMLEQNWG